MLRLGSNVGVYGFGKTGRAVIEYLLPRMLRPVVLLDQADETQLAQWRAEAGGRYGFAVGAEVEAAIDSLDTLVLSPGVPLNAPNVLRANERGVYVLSELELASSTCEGFIIAVTGTNGKSTTTKLLGHVLTAVGRTHVLGNIGTPLIENLDSIARDDFVALEVSSFQLEAIERFAPRIAIYTNLTPDHLDRHGSLEEYARVKRSMTQRMSAEDFVIVNARCPEFAPGEFENQAPTFLEYSSVPGSRMQGAWVSNGRINVDLGREQYELPLDCIKLPGVHNVENALAVIIAALLVGAAPEVVIERLSSFTGYEHRLELCRTIGNVKFYNDSKATNPEATITALHALEPPLALILGGRDKLTPLDEMIKLIRQKAGHVVIYGEARARFGSELRSAGYARIDETADLAAALPLAYAAVQEGGSVLLSPACSSFDQYNNFEARGDHFKALVAAL